MLTLNTFLLKKEKLSPLYLYHHHTARNQTTSCVDSILGHKTHVFNGWWSCTLFHLFRVPICKSSHVLHFLQQKRRDVISYVWQSLRFRYLKISFSLQYIKLFTDSSTQTVDQTSWPSWVFVNCGSFCFCCFLHITTAKVLYRNYFLLFIIEDWRRFLIIFGLKIFSIFHNDFYDCLFSVTVVKTTGREPYVAKICPNETKTLTLITCKINTERLRGPECNLTYHIEHGFNHGCDSRFRLMKEKQTIFLNLTSLTPEDSGNYSCECVYPGHTATLHLNITVEGKHKLYICLHTLVKFTLIILHCVILLTWQYDAYTTCSNYNRNVVLEQH